MSSPRHFLAIPDFSRPELIALFDLAGRMKQPGYAERPLAGKTLGMIFAKSSTRTRVSFEVGAFQLGGHALFLSARDIQLGRGEPIRDTARVLSRYLDGIMIRTYDHADVEELARFASIPVINGLTDLLHPCQVLADLLTIRETLGGWEGKVVAWIGDGNNMANSWLNAAGTLGFELRLACPEGYLPDPAILERNSARTRVTVTADPREAAKGAHVVNTDVWASMGQEEEQEERVRAFQGYIVDEALMASADPAAIFLHCLPAHRGEEVSEGVIEGPQVEGLAAGGESPARTEGSDGHADGDDMTTASQLRRTALYDTHKALGAKLVPFAGWEMPVQYSAGILAEHHAVRTAAGLFDVSHMGEFEITGPDRNAFVNRITCNDISVLESGGVQYSALLTGEGTFVDDCTVYRFEDKLMIVVNASNVARAWEHIVKQKGGANVRLKDISDEVGLLALQGPGAQALLQPLSDTRLDDIAYYRFGVGKIAGAQCFVSRTGYTGEDGFELYCRDRDTVAIWNAIIAAGAKPIGLGARDSLRLEMGYALYGNDIDDTITPLEAGLGWIVKLDKGSPFMGDKALRSQKTRGVTRKLVGFRLEGRGFPRHGYPVYHNGRDVDVVRSGTMSPSLGQAIGTTYLPAADAKPGTRFEVECRGERLPAEVVPRPFYTKGSARKK